MDSILWLTANVIYTHVRFIHRLLFIFSLLSYVYNLKAVLRCIFMLHGPHVLLCVMHDPKAFMNWVHTEIIRVQGHIHTCIWYFGRFFWIHMQFTE